MKPREALETILELTPLLTDHGLQEVYKHIKARSQFSAISGSNLTEDYLLAGILYQTEAIGMAETIPSYFKIRSGSSFNSYGTKSERIRSLIERHVPDLTLAEKLVFGRLCAKILCEHVEKWRAPDFQTLLASIGHLPAALEDAFPGYLRAGSLKFVIAAISDPHRSERHFDGGDFDC